MDKNRLVETSDGFIIELQDISFDKFKDFMERFDGKSLTKYNTEDYNVFLLNDGSLLSASGDDVIRYRNLEDFEKLLFDGSEDAQPLDNKSIEHHILQKKNVYGRDFPTHSQELVSVLLANLHISPTKIDVQLLKLIDKKVAILDAPILFLMHHYLHIVAVVGEAIRNDISASWIMKYDKESNVWEPFIEFRNKQLQFFGYVYEDVYLRQDPEMPICYETYLTVKEILRER